MEYASLRIGIDGMVTPTLRTGVGRYIESLISGLGELTPDFECIVYLGKNQEDLALLLPSRFSIKRSMVSTERSLLNFLQLQFILPFWARRDSIDVLHLPNEKLFFFKTCPVVVTIHDIGDFKVGNRTTPIRRLFRRIAMPLIIRRADHLIAVSDRTRRDLIEIFHVDPNKVSVIYEGASEYVVHKPSQGEIDRTLRRFKINCNFILFVGEISERKNIQVLLDAFRDFLRLEEQEIQLVLAGKEGDSADKIKKLLAEYNLDGRVLLTGYVTDRDLSVLYYSALCLVQPSRYEGFGLPVLEAMACGLPVIVSDTGSLPEIVIDAGLVVDCSSVKSLSKALSKVVTNQSDRDQLKLKGLQRAKQFSWTNCAIATIEVYNRVLKTY